MVKIGEGCEDGNRCRNEEERRRKGQRGHVEDQRHKMIEVTAIKEKMRNEDDRMGRSQNRMGLYGGQSKVKFDSGCRGKSRNRSVERTSTQQGRQHQHSCGQSAKGSYAISTTRKALLRLRSPHSGYPRRPRPLLAVALGPIPAPSPRRGTFLPL